MAGNNEKKRFIAGCGSVNVDLIFSGIEALPEEGEELYGKNFSMMLGGGAPGTLILLGRLGIPVRLQTGLGNDMFSRFAASELEKENVTLHNLSRGTEGIPVNISCVAVTPRDRTFLSYTDGIRRTEETARMIYESSHGAEICIMDTRYADVYEQLKKEGSRIALDMGWSESLSLDNCRPLLELADYYTPNRKEALKITGCGSPQDAAKVLAEFFDTVVIKLDAEGCLIYKEGEYFTVPVIPGIQAKDSTGAGDAFLAGYLYGIYHGFETRKAVLLGNLTGGKCVSEPGCLTASYTGQELMAEAEHYAFLCG